MAADAGADAGAEAGGIGRLAAGPGVGAIAATGTVFAFATLLAVAGNTGDAAGALVAAPILLSSLIFYPNTNLINAWLGIKATSKSKALLVGFNFWR